MSQIAHRHHYLPESYLAGFTRLARKGASVYVFDLELRKCIGQKSTRSVAFEPDWHAINWPGVKPDMFEGLLGQFEQNAKNVIERLESESSLSDEEIGTLLTFVSLTSVRVPRFRKGMIAWLENKIGDSFNAAINRPEAWEHIVKHLPKLDAGFDEDFLRHVIGTADTPMANEENWFFYNLILAQDALFKLLVERDWEVFKAESDAGEFICSDNPVGIVYSPPEWTDRMPKFSERNTVVTFPLTRNLALVGRYDSGNYFCWADKKFVARTNTMTLLRAWRYIYGASAEFACLHHEGGIGDSKYLLSKVVIDRDTSIEKRRLI